MNAPFDLYPRAFLPSIFLVQLSQVWNTALVNLLKSLYLLGLERSRQELHSVEQEVRWRLRRLTFKHVASLAEHVAAGVPKGEQNELLSDLVKHLELRWTEIEDTRIVGALMTKLGGLSPTLMDRLEDKVVAETRANLTLAHFKGKLVME